MAAASQSSMSFPWSAADPVVFQSIVKVSPSRSDRCVPPQTGSYNQCASPRLYMVDAAAFWQNRCIRCFVLPRPYELAHVAPISGDSRVDMRPIVAKCAARLAPYPPVPICDVRVSCRVQPLRVVDPSSFLRFRLRRERSVCLSRDGLSASPAVSPWQASTPRGRNAVSDGTGETRGSVEFDADGLGPCETLRCTVAPGDAQSTQPGTREVGSTLNSDRIALSVRPPLPDSWTSGRWARSMSMLRWSRPQRRDPGVPLSPTRLIMHGLLGVDWTNPHVELRYHNTSLSPHRSGSRRNRPPRLAKSRPMPLLAEVAHTVQSHENDGTGTIAEACHPGKPRLGAILATQFTSRCVSPIGKPVSTVAPSESEADTAGAMRVGPSRPLKCIPQVASGSMPEPPSETGLCPVVRASTDPTAWGPGHLTARHLIPMLLLRRTILSGSRDGNCPLEVSCV